MKFYATAKNEKGQHFVIFHEETFKDRLTAKLEAERIAKQQGLEIDNVRPIGGGESQGGTLVKYHEYRKKHGHLPKEYFNAL